MYYLKELKLLFSLGVILFSSGCKEDVVNMLPQSPVLVLPSFNATKVEKESMLIWQIVSDPDGDDIEYDVYLGTDSTQIPLVKEGLSQAMYKPILASHTKYYWKVVSKDGKGGDSESGIWSFSTSNALPDTVVVEVFFNPDIPVDPHLELKWKQTNDLDEDEITYDLYLDTLPNFTHKYMTTKDLSVDLELNNNTKYFWKVIANDGFGGSTSSATFQLVTKMGMPSSFNLLAPINKSIINESYFTLEWSAAIADIPALSNIVYDVYLDSLESLNSPFRTNITDTVLYVTGLKNGIDYKWKVVAKDNQGNERATVVNSFFLKKNALPDLPDSIIVDARDSEVYTYQQIGNQYWLTQNLRYDLGNSDVNYDSYNVAAKGRLYKYEDLSNVCPEGWRLPLKEDWDELIAFVGLNVGVGLEGKALKSESEWKPSHTLTPNGTNAYKFNGYPVGIGKMRSSGAQLYLEGKRVEYWSNTDFINNEAREVYYYYLTSDNDTFDVASTKITAVYYRHVRCIKSWN